MANPSHADLMSRRLIGIDELAELTGLSRATLWRHEAAKLLPPAIRIGRSVRFRLNLVAQWLDDGCPPQSAASSITEGAE